MHFPFHAVLEQPEKWNNIYGGSISTVVDNSGLISLTYSGFISWYIEEQYLWVNHSGSISMVHSGFRYMEHSGSRSMV